jgi:hypothetical protein
MRNYWYIPAAVLLVLIVVGFFAGWLQLSLGPDIWGVVRINARGMEKTAVSPTGFTWRWQRLVPRALTLYRIPIAAQKVELTVEATLPSADAYAGLMDDKPDLTLEMKLSVLYKIRSEALSDLVERDGLREDTVIGWHQQILSEIHQQASDIALRLAGGAAEFSDAASVAQAVTKELPGSFPQLQFISLTPTVTRMPDPELYARLRKAYLGMVDKKAAALSALAPRLAQEEAAQRSAVARHGASIDILTHYGELFDKYPSLIKFLFLATANKLTPKDLQTLDLLDKLPALE